MWICEIQLVCIMEFDLVYEHLDDFSFQTRTWNMSTSSVKLCVKFAVQNQDANSSGHLIFI
jgi:hypothetical protein